MGRLPPPPPPPPPPRRVDPESVDFHQLTKRGGGGQRYDDPDVGIKWWIAGRRPHLVPLLLLVFAAAPAAAAQTPSLSINSPSVTEGDSGSKNLTFTVTLSAASSGFVTVDYDDAETGTITLLPPGRSIR